MHWLGTIERRRIKRSVYAVSKEGIGIIAGTNAYSRRRAIERFQGCGFTPREWERAKREGYRTVCTGERAL